MDAWESVCKGVEGITVELSHSADRGMDLLPPWPPPIPEHSPGISGLLSHTESTALNSPLYRTKVLQNLWPFLLFSFPLSQNSPPFCWISPAFFFFFFSFGVPSDPPFCLRYAFVVRKQPGSRTKADRLNRYNGKQTQNLLCGAGHQLKKSILKCVVELRWGNGVVKARHDERVFSVPWKRSLRWIPRHSLQGAVCLKVKIRLLLYSCLELAQDNGFVYPNKVHPVPESVFHTNDSDWM